MLVMETLLTQLGLSEKEAKVYAYLVAETTDGAAQIAKAVRESRTNTYMILERLIEEHLVEVDDSGAVRRFRAAEPSRFRQRLISSQQQLRQQQAALEVALPELTAQYNLGQHRPGVVYLQGIGGFRTLLEDCAKTEGTIDLIASDNALSNTPAWELLQKGIAKRKARGVLTRGLFHAPEPKWGEIKKFENRGYEVKRWRAGPLPGEIVIYSNKVAFTVYQPELVVTILTNEAITETFRAIFEDLWTRRIDN